MENIQQFTYENVEEPTRLDIFLVEQIGQSRSQIQKLIKKDLVFVNDKLPKKAGDHLKAGDVVVIKPEEKNEDVEEEKTVEETITDIPVLADKKDYLIIMKPAGVLVHPTEAGEKNTVTNWLLKNYPEIEGVGEHAMRPGIVHRLDKEASGVLVIAKTQEMHQHLKEQFKSRTVGKLYSVLVYGNIEAHHGTIDFAIDRSKDGRMASRPNVEEVTLKTVKKIQPGKKALTEFWVEKEYINYTLLKVKIHTGRTHQIRVHMLAYNHPVVGDTLYFNKKLRQKRGDELNRLFLHAKELTFKDLNGEEKTYTAELPKELQSFLENIK